MYGREIRANSTWKSGARNSLLKETHLPRHVIQIGMTDRPIRDLDAHFRGPRWSNMDVLHRQRLVGLVRHCSCTIQAPTHQINAIRTHIPTAIAPPPPP
jgi:hypothetical protein